MSLRGLRLRASAACALVLAAGACSAGAEGGGGTDGGGGADVDPVPGYFCTYWMTVAVDQDDAQLVRVDVDGNATQIELDGYGEPNAAGVELSIAVSPTAAYQKPVVLVAAGTVQAGAPYAERWQLLDADGELIRALDWPDVASAAISPDGQRAVVTTRASESIPGKIQVRELASSSVVWEMPMAPGMSTDPASWYGSHWYGGVHDIFVYPTGTATGSLINLPDGASTNFSIPAQISSPMPWASALDEPFDYWLGTEANTLHVYDSDFEVVHQLADALPQSGFWLRNGVFAYLSIDGYDEAIEDGAAPPTSAPDLVLMDADSGKTDVLIEDFAREIIGDDGQVNDGSLSAYCRYG